MKRSPLLPALVLLLLALVVGSVYFRPIAAERKPERSLPTSPPLVGPPAISSAVPIPVVSAKPPEPSDIVRPAAAPAPKDPKPRVFEIRGRVVDVTGAVQPFLKVEAFAVDGRGDFRHLEAETDEKGTFKMGCPEWTRVTFTAHLPGHGRGFTNLETTDPEHLFGTVNDITLTLRAPTAFDGQLTLPDGGPAAGATLRFHPVSSRFMTPDGEKTEMNLLNGTYPPNVSWDRQCREALYLTDCLVTTDTQGQFRAQSLAAGVNYTIDVERPGRDRARFDLHVKAWKDRLTLQLPP